MGIYIHGMKMPKSCWECPCINGENGYCQLRKEYVYGEIPRSCPLVPVPPHGRLIDADALYKDLLEDVGYGEAERFNDYWLGEQPTIIPAEEGE